MKTTRIGGWIGVAGRLLLGAVFACACVAVSAQTAPYDRLTGVFTGPNGLPLPNNVISFEPTQMFFVPGTNSTTPVDNIVSNVMPTNPCAIESQLYTYTGTAPPTVYQCVFGVWIQINGSELTLEHGGTDLPDQSVLNFVDTPASLSGGALDSGYQAVKFKNDAVGGLAAETIASSEQFLMAQNAPTIGQYVIVYPTAYTPGTTGRGFAVGSPTGGSIGSAYLYSTSAEAGTSTITWSNPALPSYVLPANVTAVYAFAFSQMSLGAPPTTPVELCGGSGIPWTLNLGFSSSIAATASSLGSFTLTQDGGNVPFTVNEVTALMTGMTGTNFHTSTITANFSTSGNCYGPAANGIPLVGYYVYYTGSAPPVVNSVNVLSPLYFDPSTMYLGISPNAQFPGTALVPTIVQLLPVPGYEPGWVESVTDGQNSGDPCVAGGGTTFAFCKSSGSAWAQYVPGGGMVYPGAGVPKSTGSAWGTSYGVDGTGPNVEAPSGTAGAGKYIDGGTFAWTTLPAGLLSPLTTKGDLWGYSTTNARLPVGPDTYVLTADSTQTLGVKWAPAASGGVLSMNALTGALDLTSTSGTVTITPSGTNIDLEVSGSGGAIPGNAVLVFAGDSKNDDDSNAIAPAITLAGWTCATGTCTVTNSGTNGLAAGDFVNMRYGSAWTSTFSAPTDISLSTGYTLFKVLSSGLSSTQFEFSFASSGTCSSTCGTAAKATYNLPFNTDHITGLAADPNVVIPNPVTMQALNTDYTTILHPLSEAVSGLPTYFVLGDFEDDIAASSAGCNSAATIEAAMQSLWAKIHTDGSSVVVWSDSAFSYNQSAIGSCSSGYQVWIALQQWLPLQGKSAANQSSGQYWDEFADVGRVVNDPQNTNLIASNGGFAAGGVNLAAAKIAGVLLSGHSDPLDKRPDYFGAGASTSSAGNGFNRVPSADSIYYESWWDAAFDTQVFGIGTLSGYRRFFANTAATNTITDTSGMTYGGPIFSVTEGYGSYSPYVNDYPMTTVFAPNQGNGGTPFWEWGYANSTNNAINLAFSYASAGSASNFVTLALKGTNGIKIDGSGNFYVPGLGSSTSPLCTTTGGELTIVGCDSVGSGTNVEVNGGSALSTLNITGDTTQACADTSGSGTAQSCSTSTSFTPTTNNCVIYTTTTANSGTGLTLNINSLGAKSAAVPSSSGWTTTLTASQIPSGTPMLACYNGTQWNLAGTGIQASSGGSAPANLGSLTYNASGTTTFAAASAAVAGGKVTATHSTSTTFSPTGLVAWGSYTLEIIEDSTGGGVTFTLGTAGTCSAWKIGGAGAGAITLSTGANVIDVLAFTYDGTNCVANFRQSFN